MKYSIWGEDLLVQRKAYNIFREMQMVMELKQEPAILLSLEAVEEIVGFEVSLHIPDLNSVTPVRYIMEPEYVSQQELKQENTMQQVEDAKDTESWTVDQSDGTMYFFLDENNGWRLVITDAAAGKQILCNGKDNGWWFYLGMHK